MTLPSWIKEARELNELCAASPSGAIDILNQYRQALPQALDEIERVTAERDYAVETIRQMVDSWRAADPQALANARALLTKQEG